MFFCGFIDIFKLNLINLLQTRKSCFGNGEMTTREEVVRGHQTARTLPMLMFTFLDEVVQIFELCLADKVKKLGAERLVVLEQVFVAALDCGRIKLAEDCIRVLISEFPESLRIMKHKAMLLEALERYDDALDVLENIIKKDETNAAARKRKVAILKAKGLIGEAIKELCDYLKK